MKVILADIIVKIMSSSSSQPSQSLSDKQEEEEWKLKDCSMEVVNIGKRDAKDEFMTIDLIFRFHENPAPIAVGKCVLRVGVGAVP